MNLLSTLEERMESEAEFGLFYLDAKIGKNKAETLRKLGFEVLDSKETNYFPRLHHISWKNAEVKCIDISLLDEKSNIYTFPQKLWIISKKQSNI